MIQNQRQLVHCFFANTISEPRSLDPDLNFFENGRSGSVCNEYGSTTLVLCNIRVLKISGDIFFEDGVSLTNGCQMLYRIYSSKCEKLFKPH